MNVIGVAPAAASSWAYHKLLAGLGVVGAEPGIFGGADEHQAACGCDRATQVGVLSGEIPLATSPINPSGDLPLAMSPLFT